jgi:hypothetical protein
MSEEAEKIIQIKDSAYAGIGYDKLYEHSDTVPAFIDFPDVTIY